MRSGISHKDTLLRSELKLVLVVWFEEGETRATKAFEKGLVRFHVELLGVSGFKLGDVVGSLLMVSVWIDKLQLVHF